jgi:sterol O-acyltransferase
MVNRDLRERNDKAWPGNITARNFFVYLVMPVLVYQISYPRNASFRPVYFIKKATALVLELVFVYLIASDYILPAIAEKLGFLHLIIRLIVPVMFINITMFEIIFELLCNLFAEITLFADREFYRDWWNSTSFIEYNRNWNRPVHLFLLKHIY